MNLTSSDFYDQATLEDRLTQGVQTSSQPVRFLVGSAITAAYGANSNGVLDVGGVVSLIKQQFNGESADKLEAELSSANNIYQSAFQFLVGRRGQSAANSIIKQAVLAARIPTFSTTESGKFSPNSYTSDEVCEEFDRDISGWSLSPAVSALGELAAMHPQIFGKHILTTNFDPLIGVAINRAGGKFIRTVVHRDGDLGQTSGDGCHIIHCHGYWYGADTLHTPRQLTQDRPRLKASLSHILGKDLLVVSGYGGWDDVITRTLMDVALDDRISPEIIWTFKDKNPVISEEILKLLQPGIDRGRVTLYGGVDCHSLFPALASSWARTAKPIVVDTGRVRPSPAIKSRAITRAPSLRKPSGKLFFDDHDRDSPPDIQFYVGREFDRSVIESSKCPVAIITGLGGQGKSAVAAKYFSNGTALERFRYRIWRDCREESDRFERQIASLISAMSRGQVSANELSAQTVQNLVDLFVNLIGEDKFLFVFDNVDHYVDLESGKIGGAPGQLIEKLAEVSNGSQFIFTCRPSVRDMGVHVLIHRVSGLSVDEAIKLFNCRGASATQGEIADAHLATEGHALWLDLIAAQVAKKGSEFSLPDTLAHIPGSGRGEIPERTLQTIWETLTDRERLVLRALAETVRSSTEMELSDFLVGQLKFIRIQKAVDSLRDQSLVVIKQSQGFQRIVDLHPVLRDFIRRRFSKAERIGFIDAIIKFYLPFLSKSMLTGPSRPTLENLQKWIDVAQLHIESGSFDKAFIILSDVAVAMKRSAAPGEFVRVSSRLFSEIDWSEFESYAGSEVVIENSLNIMARLGRIEDCNNLLDSYLSTIEGKSARYIHYCDLNCYLNWVNDNFPVAIRWGEEGASLKNSSNVDTQFDTKHNLALARRDAGFVEDALVYFQSGMNLEDITSPDQIDEDRAGAFYGNVGRCLQLMGQIEPAINCYRKSAKLIEKKPDGEHVSNQAYIRQWTGELMITKGEDRLGEAFLRASLAKWEIVSPHRAGVLSRGIEALEELSSDMSFDDCEKAFLDWAS